jgi:hypothetical protein
MGQSNPYYGGGVKITKYGADTIEAVLLQNEGELRESKKDLTNLLVVRDDLFKTPFLSEGDVLDAYKMTDLYVILHCFENSVRKFVEKTLVQNLGDDWWEQAANNTMKNVVTQLKMKEKKRKWLSVRGNVSPLYYLEWGDLEKLIRKYENLFKPHIGDLRFIESRFGDLENLRHIVAHHGVLPSEDDFQRAKLYFKDWCRQIGDD